MPTPKTDSASELFGSTPPAVEVVLPTAADTVVEVPSAEVVMKAMELDLLKERADQIGITYHPAIGIASLRAKIAAAINAAEMPEPVVVMPAEVVEVPVDSSMAALNQKAALRAEAHKLVRVVVSCMNPAKQIWEGEVFTLSNAVVGTVKKYIPFNIDAGWHIPQIIYNHLVERKCQVFYTVVDSRTGMKTRRGKLINEFNVVVLPALTETELKELAVQQAANNSID